MKQPPHPPRQSVYNVRALTIGFGVFAVLEAVAIIWVVHISVGRPVVTGGVAAVFAVVLFFSFRYAAQRHRQEASERESARAALPGEEAGARLATLEGNPSWSGFPAPGKAELMSVKNVEVSVGDHKILDVDELSAREGEMVVLAGRNGSGKTTLLRAIGNLIPHRGEISIRGDIGYMPDRPALYPRLTGAEHIALVMGMKNVPRDSRRAVAKAFLSRFELADVADRRVRGWSLGMRRKLTLALAMCGQPEVLLLDEPGDALDGPTFEELGRLLHEHLKGGGAAIIASHDPRIAASAHRVVMIDKGRVTEIQPAT